MLSPLKTEEVSQNCFVFDVVKLENCGRLAEFLRFQLRTLRGLAELLRFQAG